MRAKWKATKRSCIPMKSWALKSWVLKRDRRLENEEKKQDTEDKA